MKSSRVIATITLMAGPAICPRALAGPFYMGGDVSLLPFIESRGGSFRDDGQVRPLEQIMVNHGANLFRLRLFVNPNTAYEATSGAIQDLNYDIALAQRLKATGANILLDFHFSDTWADPGHQTKPAAWVGQDFATLNTTVRNYTRDSLLAFKNAGVMPEMVQIGNEVTNGMLWSDGSILYSGGTATQNASWQRFGQLVNSGIAGVRDVDVQTAGQHTDVAIHIDGGNVQGRAQYYYNQITSIAGISDYDTFAMSFYPATTSALTNLSGNLNYLANNTAKKVMVNEFNYPWKGSATGAQWPSTQTGQRDALIAVRDLIRNLPNGRGAGMIWWYPEAIQVPGTFIYKAGAIALFDDSGGDALPALSEFSLSPPVWNIDANGSWYNAMNWSGGVPMFAGNAANFGSVITAPRTVSMNTALATGIINFDNNNSYTIVGASTLTLDSVSGDAAIMVNRGSQVIAAPVGLNDNLTVNVAASATLSVPGTLYANGRNISKAGNGYAEFTSIRAGAVSVNAGTLAVIANGTAGGAGRITSLTIAGGSEPTAALDLNDNDLMLTSAAYANVATSISYARHGGAWDRPGLTSSAARNSSPAKDKTLGVLTGAQYRSIYGGAAAFDGFGVADSDVLVKYTYYGDTDFNGKTDGADYARIDTAFNQESTVGDIDGWYNGDFDFSGRIDGADYALIDAAFNSQNGTLDRAVRYITGADRSLDGMGGPALGLMLRHFDRFGSEYSTSFLSIVPEPALATIGCCGVILGLSRRRRAAVANLKV